MDMRYFGQSYELAIPTSKPFDEEALHRVIDDFHKKHETMYGYAVKEEPVELVNIEVKAMGVVDKPRLRKQVLKEEEPSSNALIGRRKVFFEGDNDFTKTSIYSREKLKSGNRISGPAIIEQYDSTTVVYPEWKASVDEIGNIVLVIERGRTG
jgi:N-methylhydantoinase A